jgi:hypothetical protein
MWCPYPFVTHKTKSERRRHRFVAPDDVIVSLSPLHLLLSSLVTVRSAVHFWLQLFALLIYSVSILEGQVWRCNWLCYLIIFWGFVRCSEWACICRYTIPELLCIPEFHTGTYQCILSQFIYLPFSDGISLFRFLEIYQSKVVPLRAILTLAGRGV